MFGKDLNTTITGILVMIGGIVHAISPYFIPGQKVNWFLVIVAIISGFGLTKASDSKEI